MSTINEKLFFESSLKDTQMQIAHLLDNLTKNTTDSQSYDEIHNLYTRSNAILSRFNANLSEMQHEFSDILQSFENGTMTGGDLQAFIDAEVKKGLFTLGLADDLTSFLENLFNSINDIMQTVTTTGTIGPEEVNKFVNILDRSMETIVSLSRVATSGRHNVENSINTSQMNALKLSEDPNRGYFRTQIMQSNTSANKDISYEDAISAFSTMKVGEKKVQTLQGRSLNNKAASQQQQQQQPSYLPESHFLTRSPSYRFKGSCLQRNDYDLHDSKESIEKDLKLRRSKMVTCKIFHFHMESTSTITTGTRNKEVFYGTETGVTASEQHHNIDDDNDHSIAAASNATTSSSHRRAASVSVSSKHPKKSSSISSKTQGSGSGSSGGTSSTTHGKGKVNASSNTNAQAHAHASSDTQSSQAQVMTEANDSNDSLKQRSNNNTAKNNAMDKLKLKLKCDTSMLDLDDDWMDELSPEIADMIKKHLNCLHEQQQSLHLQEKENKRILDMITLRQHELNQLQETAEAARASVPLSVSVSLNTRDNQDIQQRIKELQDKTVEIQKKEQSLKLLEMVTLRRTQELEAELLARDSNDMAVELEKRQRDLNNHNMECQTVCSAPPTEDWTLLRSPPPMAVNTSSVQQQSLKAMTSIAPQNRLAKRRHSSVLQLLARQTMDAHSVMRIMVCIASFIGGVGVGGGSSLHTPCNNFNLSTLDKRQSVEMGTGTGTGGRSLRKGNIGNSSGSSSSSTSSISSRNGSAILSSFQGIVSQVLSSNNNNSTQDLSLRRGGGSMLLRTNSSIHNISMERNSGASHRMSTMRRQDSKSSIDNNMLMEMDSKDTSDTITIYPVNTNDKSTSCEDLVEFSNSCNVRSTGQSKKGESEGQNSSGTETVSIQSLLGMLSGANKDDMIKTLGVVENPLLWINDTFSSVLPDFSRARLLKAATGKLDANSINILSRTFMTIYKELTGCIDGKISDAERLYGGCQEHIVGCRMLESIRVKTADENLQAALQAQKSAIGTMRASFLTLQMLLAEYRAIFDHVNASDIAKLPKLLQSCVDYQKSIQVMHSHQSRMLELSRKVAALSSNTNTTNNNTSPSTTRQRNGSTPIPTPSTSLTPVPSLSLISDHIAALQVEDLDAKLHYEETRELLLEVQKENNQLKQSLFDISQQKDRTPGAMLFFAALQDDGLVSTLQQLELQLDRMKSFSDGSDHMDFALLRKRIQVCTDCLPNLHIFLSRFGAMFQKWSQDRWRLIQEGKYTKSADLELLCPTCHADTRTVTTAATVSRQGVVIAPPSSPSYLAPILVPNRERDRERAATAAVIKESSQPRRSIQSQSQGHNQRNSINVSTMRGRLSPLKGTTGSPVSTAIGVSPISKSGSVAF